MRVDTREAVIRVESVTVTLIIIIGYKLVNIIIYEEKGKPYLLRNNGKISANFVN